MVFYYVENILKIAFLGTARAQLGKIRPDLVVQHFSKYFRRYIEVTLIFYRFK